MPHDKFQGSVYKYILTGVDVASRYKVAKPLRTKKASDVAFLLKNIYESKDNPLKWPEVFQCDNGSEFKGDVTKLLESHDVKINALQQNTSIPTQRLLKILTKFWQKNSS